MIELRQTTEYANYMQLLGWSVEHTKQGVWVYIKKLPLLPFSVLKIQRLPPEKLDLNWLSKLRKKYRVIISYIELNNNNKKVSTELLQAGYKPESMAMLPTKTLRIDLSVSKSKILSQMKSKARYNIGLSARHNKKINVVPGGKMLKYPNQLNEYLSLMRSNSRRLKLLSSHPSWIMAQLESFKEKSFVVLVHDEKSDLVAAGMYLQADKGIYYEHNGSTEKGRRQMAPTAVVWQGIIEGRKRGLKYFDFDGIYDDRYPIKRWKGFSKFKKSFGGKEISYPPAYKKWF